MTGLDDRENLHFVKDLGLQSQAALEAGNLHEFARLMDVHWQRKKQRSGGMSNPKINECGMTLALASRRAPAASSSARVKGAVS